MKDNMGIMIAILAVIALQGAKPNGGGGGGIFPPEELPPPTGGCSAKDQAHMQQWIYWLRNGMTSQLPEWFATYALGCDPCQHYSDLGAAAKYYWNREFSGCAGYNTW